MSNAYHGATLCRYCAEPIVLTGGQWLHEASNARQCGPGEFAEPGECVVMRPAPWWHPFRRGRKEPWRRRRLYEWRRCRRECRPPAPPTSRRDKWFCTHGRLWRAAYHLDVVYVGTVPVHCNESTSGYYWRKQ